MLPDRLETARLILRPIARQDAPAIFTGYAQDLKVVGLWFGAHTNALPTPRPILLAAPQRTPIARAPTLWPGERTAGFWAPSSCVDPSPIGSIANMCWRVPFGGVV